MQLVVEYREFEDDWGECRQLLAAQTVEELLAEVLRVEVELQIVTVASLDGHGESVCCGCC
jgi:hypothetical protein